MLDIDLQIIYTAMCSNDSMNKCGETWIVEFEPPNGMRVFAAHGRYFVILSVE